MCGEAGMRISTSESEPMVFLQGMVDYSLLVGHHGCWVQMILSKGDGKCNPRWTGGFVQQVVI